MTPGGPLDVDLSRNLVAILDTTNHKLRVYDISNPAAPVQTDGTKDMAANANGNLVGSVWLRDAKLFALETANGIRAYTLHEVVLPPSIVTQPASVTVWENAIYPLTLGVSGTAPLAYQWQYGGANLPGATNAVLTITNFAVSNAGTYRVLVSNVSGSVTSSSAVLTVTATPASAAGRRRAAKHSAGADVARRILVARVALHRPRLALHVHQDDRGPPLRDQRQRARRRRAR